MSDDLPMRWELVNIGQIADVTKLAGFEFTNYFNYRDFGEVRVVRGLNIGFGNFKSENFKYIDASTANLLTRSQLNGGEILITYVGTLGCVAILPKDGFRYHLGPNVGKITVNNDIAETKFLMFYILSPLGNREIHQTSKAVAQSSLSMKQIRLLSVPLPPLNEQRRIVEKLDRIGDRQRSARNELSHIPKLIARYKQAVLAAAFRGDLTADWRNQNNEIILDSEEFLFVNYSDEYEFSGLPNSWILSCIDKIGIVKGGKRLPKGEKLVEWNTGFPYIRAGNLKNGTVVTCELLFVTEDIRKVIRNYTVSSGDVYITIVGACIGDAGIIPKNLDGANLTENAAKICDLKQCDNRYLALWLRSSICQDMINHKTLSAAQGKLALTRIKTIPIPLPPLAEQKEIVRRVEKMFAKIDKMEEEYQKAVKLCDRLEQATLAKAFRGELVPQDPNDEPASVLLEQVKREKEKGKIKTKK